MAVEIRSAFSPRKRVAIKFEGNGRTKQSEKDACDVNLIVKRFIATGELPSGNMRSPVFGDVTGLEFRGMMDVIAAAQAAFEALPASVRKRFANDPAEFVEFCSDAENASEMVKLGLANKRTEVGSGKGKAVEVAKPVAPVVGAPGGESAKG